MAPEHCACWRAASWPHCSLGGRHGHVPQTSGTLSHLQHRPQHQLHQRLYRRLPFLRVLPPARRPQGYVSNGRRCTGRSRRPSPWAATRFCSQGGLHPDLPLDWYEDLLRDIKGGFRRSTSTVSARRRSTTSPGFRAAGPRRAGAARRRPAWEALPGGGAEILVDRVRQAVSRCKVSADRLAGGLPHAGTASADADRPR